MDERPSFRCRADARLLIIALLTPWILGGFAYAGPLVARGLYRSGFQPELLGPATLVWFYSFGFPALFSLPAWFLFGVWRLAWRPGFRWSWYGWLWLFFVWVDLCLVAPVIGH